MTLGGMFTEKYVFGQHLTEPTASNLPCSLIYEQTTKQGQIGPKPETAPGSYLNAREVVYIYIDLSALTLYSIVLKCNKVYLIVFAFYSIVFNFILQITCPAGSAASGGNVRLLSGRPGYSPGERHSHGGCV